MATTTFSWSSWFDPGWWSALVERLNPLKTADGRVVSTPGLWYPGDGAATYGALYRAQPHVRTVVDFLAIQLGQLGIHVFRRVSDTDRVRVADHPLARLLKAPNPGATRYSFILEIVQDWAIYGNAYALKVRRPGRLELYRVPAAQMRPVGDLIPRAYTWTLPDGHGLALDANDVFHVRDYNPDDPVVGLSRLETLRKTLAEEAASVNYREWFWSNGAKLAGWIGRPREAPRWSEQQREQFRNEWGQFTGPRNAGKTAVLEDGMSFNPVTATARESELIAARKLTREEVAAASHVPPAMIGIVEAQGYGSLREQHRALYQDTLGPIVALLEGEISRQLLSEFSDSDDTYVQFNIQEKLQGSFEEEQAALSVAVGSPYMTRNEARARMNLPRINDQTFDQPVTRLDIAEGQQNASLSIKDRIDALGGLIRAGFDPAESLEALDLPAIKHLGLAPVTVQPEEDEP
jgi:HK97 family phage portal protein